jgi:putative ABC transport system permease protein
MEAEIRALPGVADVQGARTARILINGKPIMMVAIDVADVSRHVKLPAVAGRQDEMYRRAANREGVIVSENFSLLHGFQFGQTIALNTPTGEARLPIVGVVTDYSDQQGSILIDRALYQRYWKDDTINVFRVYAKGSPEELRKRILDRFQSDRRVFVLSNSDVKAYILRLTDQWFGLTYVQIAVAVLVAILGIVNTLTVSITDRRRELGVLQAIGGLRGQIRRTIWLEALCIGTVGLVLGLAVGAAQLYYSLEIARRDLAGIRLNYEYPVNIALVLVPVILIAAFVSALGPAESAVRGSLVEALEYE